LRCVHTSRVRGTVEGRRRLWSPGLRSGPRGLEHAANRSAHDARSPNDDCDPAVEAAPPLSGEADRLLGSICIL
jgi:hypothetical protein